MHVPGSDRDGPDGAVIVTVRLADGSGQTAHADADLIGVPVRMIVSPKGLKNGTIEISARDKSMKELKPVEEAVDFVTDYVRTELEKLNCRL